MDNQSLIISRVRASIFSGNLTALSRLANLGLLITGLSLDYPDLNIYTRAVILPTQKKYVRLVAEFLRIHLPTEGYEVYWSLGLGDDATITIYRVPPNYGD